MKEGTVGKWYKKEGDAVQKDEPIVEIVSEKATYDLEAPASGVLRRIYAEAGVTALVDKVLAVITDPNEAFSEAELPTEPSRQSGKEAERIIASPAAKRLAREHNVNLALVRSSGPDGRIVEEDIRRFIKESRDFQPKVKQVIQLSGFRKTTAERVASSFRTAPHSTLVMEVDASKMAQLHKQLEVSYTAIIVKAAAKALVEHSVMNSTLTEEQIKIFEDVNIGVATATEHGLIVPVIHNAGKKSLQEMEAAIKELMEKAKVGRLAKEELTGGTFTVTNLGMYGVELFTPIINPPEAAILGVGTIADKPVVIDRRIEVRPMMSLSLSYDHRIVDGAPAADFLRKIKEKLEKASETEG
jgi:pyruvate dehydrogenase E2 component (dihydrolipoamide acetyltransferase)